MRFASNAERNDEAQAIQHDLAGSDGPARFCFGARRYPASGSRRLFALRECVLPPVYDIEASRPHALLRVLSNYV